MTGEGRGGDDNSNGLNALSGRVTALRMPRAETLVSSPVRLARRAAQRAADQGPGPSRAPGQPARWSVPPCRQAGIAGARGSWSTTRRVQTNEMILEINYDIRVYRASSFSRTSGACSGRMRSQIFTMRRCSGSRHMCGFEASPVVPDHL